MGGDQLVDRGRPPGARDIWVHGWRIGDERDGGSPKPLDPVRACEQGAVADERVVDQALVRLEVVGARE